MSTSINTEKVFGKTQYTFIIKTLNKLGIEENFLNLIKIIYGFPSGWDGKESTCNARDPGLIFGLGRSLEKGIATHSSILAWRIPRTGESVGLQSMESQRVGHDWGTNTRFLKDIVFICIVRKLYHCSMPNFWRHNPSKTLVQSIFSIQLCACPAASVTAF